MDKTSSMGSSSRNSAAVGLLAVMQQQQFDIFVDKKKRSRHTHYRERLITRLHKIQIAELCQSLLLLTATAATTITLLLHLRCTTLYDAGTS